MGVGAGVGEGVGVGAGVGEDMGTGTGVAVGAVTAVEEEVGSDVRAAVELARDGVAEPDGVPVVVGVSATSPSPPPQATRATNAKQTSTRRKRDRVDDRGPLQESWPEPLRAEGLPT